jgi:peptidoglycan/xylan/chitin deacetylase (PgdA/CDA1 family)
MRKSEVRLRLRLRSGWAASLKVAVLPVVVLLLTAGYWQSRAPAEAARPGEAQSAAIGTRVLADTATLDPPAPTGTAAHDPPAPTLEARVERPSAGGRSQSTPLYLAMDSTPRALPATPTRTPTPSPTPTVTPTPLQPTPDGVRRTAHVPILMYHHVEIPPAGADALRRDLSIAPAAFEQQLRYLKQEGYQSVTLKDLTLYLTLGQPLAARPVVLTFDDGYRDAYTHVFPLLQQFGFVGTFFLVTEPIDTGNPDWLTWDQVKEMHAAGMEFEPHSLNHPDLRDRTIPYLIYQILASQGAVEERTGEPSRFFAYPAGRYDQKVIDVLRSADFWGAVLTEQGATHTTGDLFALRRVRVQPDDSLEQFAVKLRLDW